LSGADSAVAEQFSADRSEHLFRQVPQTLGVVGVEGVPGDAVQVPDRRSMVSVSLQSTK